MPNRSKIIAATVKVAAIAKTGKMIADNASPMATAPIPICKALTHVGDFLSTTKCSCSAFISLYIAEVALKDSKTELILPS
jgi:hypothetical protein